MSKNSLFLTVVVASGLLTTGVAVAQSPVPQTGSAQGTNSSNSLPGGSAAFGSSSSASPTPMSATPPSGAAQGVITSPSGQNTGAVTTIKP